MKRLGVWVVTFLVLVAASSAHLASAGEFHRIPDELSDAITATFSGLDEDKYKSLLLCVRGKTKSNFSETVAHNLRRGGSDALWALKVSAIESAILAYAAQAAQWPKMRRYYAREADNLVGLIRGKIETAKFKEAAKENEAILAEALGREKKRLDVHKRNLKKLQSECAHLSEMVIGRAKIAASQ